MDNNLVSFIPGPRQTTSPLSDAADTQCQPQTSYAISAACRSYHDECDVDDDVMNYDSDDDDPWSSLDDDEDLLDHGLATSAGGEG